MSTASQTPQERRPANLAALHQSLHELAARTKSSASTTKARPVMVQGPVLLIRGK